MKLPQPRLAFLPLPLLFTCAVAHAEVETIKVNPDTGALVAPDEAQFKTANHLAIGVDVQAYNAALAAVASAGGVSFSSLLGRPSTVAGYGIADALTLGGNGAALTGLTAAQVGLGNVPNVDATDAAHIVSGTLAVARGGTGAGAFSNGLLEFAGGAFATAADGADYLSASKARGDLREAEFWDDFQRSDSAGTVGAIAPSGQTYVYLDQPTASLPSVSAREMVNANTGSLSAYYLEIRAASGAIRNIGCTGRFVTGPAPANNGYSQGVLLLTDVPSAFLPSNLVHVRWFFNQLVLEISNSGVPGLRLVGTLAINSPINEVSAVQVTLEGAKCTVTAAGQTGVFYDSAFAETVWSVAIFEENGAGTGAEFDTWHFQSIWCNAPVSAVPGLTVQPRSAKLDAFAQGFGVTTNSLAPQIETALSLVNTTANTGVSPLQISPNLAGYFIQVTDGTNDLRGWLDASGTHLYTHNAVPLCLGTNNDAAQIELSPAGHLDLHGTGVVNGGAAAFGAATFGGDVALAVGTKLVIGPGVGAVGGGLFFKDFGSGLSRAYLMRNEDYASGDFSIDRAVALGGNPTIPRIYHDGVNNRTSVGHDAASQPPGTAALNVEGSGTLYLAPQNSPQGNCQIWSDGTHLYWRDASGADRQLDN